MMMSSKVHDNSHYEYHFDHSISLENSDVEIICPSGGNGFLATGGRMVDRSGRYITSAFMKRYRKFSIFQWHSRCSKNFKAGTWNIEACSLENPVKFEELKMVMNDHDISILCLQETHLSETFYIDIDGFLFIAS